MTSIRALHNSESFCCIGRGRLLRCVVIVQRGPPDSPFAGGEYHGMLMFPSEYPFKPPGIKVCLFTWIEPHTSIVH
jgi:ubiquitin-protein ligase